MENASKALIIAGGVLIGVALISLALYLFASARGLTDASNEILTQSQIESFNRFYFAYAPNLNEKADISGLDAYNIIRRVKNDNDSETTFSEISLYTNGLEAEVSESTNFFKKNYQLLLRDTNGDTAIDSVTISKAAS